MLKKGAGMGSIIFWALAAVVVLILLSVLWSGLKVIFILGIIAVIAHAVYKALNLGKTG